MLGTPKPTVPKPCGQISPRKLALRPRARSWMVTAPHGASAHATRLRSRSNAQTWCRRVISVRGRVVGRSDVPAWTWRRKQERREQEGCGGLQVLPSPFVDGSATEVFREAQRQRPRDQRRAEHVDTLRRLANPPRT